MFKKKLFISIFLCAICLVAGFASFFPSRAFAFNVPAGSAPAMPAIRGQIQIIPCGTDKNSTCTPCDLFKLGQNIITFLMTIAGAVAILNIIIAGIMYITNSQIPGAEKGSKIATGKNMLTYTIGGFIVILLSWVIINTVVSTLGYTKAGSWSTIDCTEANKLLDTN